MSKQFSELSKSQRNRRILLSYNSDRAVAYSQPISLSIVDDDQINDGPSQSSVFAFEEQEVEGDTVEINNSGSASSESDNNISHDNDSVSSSETNIINDEFQIDPHPQENMHYCS